MGDLKKFIIKMCVGGSVLLLFPLITSLIYETNSQATELSLFEATDLASKVSYLEAHKDSFDAVFIGSSMIWRHVDPLLFDSLTGTRSYNLGSGGFRPVRSFALLESLSRSKLNLKYVFLELNRIETLRSNFNSDPSVRALNAKNYSLVISSVLDSDYSLRRKLQYVGIYTATLVYKYFGTGVLSRISPLHIRTDFPGKSRHRGFEAIDWHAIEHNDKAALSRNRYIMENRHLLDTLASRNRPRRAPGHPTPLAYSEFLSDMVRVLKANGTELIFIINPRNFESSDVEFLLRVSNELKPATVISLYDPTEYPEFYDYNLTFDLAHLNSDGARIYTRVLAEQFMKSTRASARADHFSTTSK
jgi:hypothetical protein